MTIHREGYKYITIASVLFVILAGLNHYFLNKPGCGFQIIYWFLQTGFFLLWFWVLWFFRIPNRTFTQGDNVIVAPADGKVVVIEETTETEYFKDKRLQVSIFMSPLNVHVNRSPIKGLIKYVKYHPGKYLVAWHPKSSTENERTTVVVGNNQITLLMRQIAGALARRICYYVKDGQTIEQNAEFGFIRFGSRVDIYFPVGTKIEVNIGDKVKGGQTILAKV
ncbi:phosphatidylserine decarboxylase family protein [Taibaiella sp. KBW10]|uniref:phosphatidylserine decarboxylase family protein n=1 Tax=Taibaiella sp. KBW10 TaxID=2153357 RepID=UPI000F595F0C|nr:phosphatidylserine decarboxylase family protein [Taibaiella sp. KBW10]RQO30333.1 phosphatidylserine decarboxylase family protein [Taibaiella sp. KBW10]